MVAVQDVAKAISFFLFLFSRAGLLCVTGFVLSLQTEKDKKQVDLLTRNAGFPSKFAMFRCSGSRWNDRRKLRRKICDKLYLAQVIQARVS